MKPNALFVRVDALPAPTLAGLPTVTDDGDTATVIRAKPGVLDLIMHRSDNVRTWPECRVFLDLRPPDTVCGHPLWLDGFPVAAGMLGTALGEVAYASPQMPGFFYNPGGIYDDHGVLQRVVPAWCVRTASGYRRIAAERESHTSARQVIILPELADIDPEHPHRDRFALALCLRRKVWQRSEVTG